LHFGVDTFTGDYSAVRFFVTKAEEQNMWGRLVVLEKIVAKLVEKSAKPREELPPVEPVADPHVVEPPRDLYGAAVGRPDM
jgi:hypothetical protein